MNDATSASSITKKNRLWMIVGEQRFPITLADNAAARTFAALPPLALDMRDLNSKEKYASLPEVIPVDARKPGRIRRGDLMLYGAG